MAALGTTVIERVFDWQRHAELSSRWQIQSRVGTCPHMFGHLHLVAQRVPHVARRHALGERLLRCQRVKRIEGQLAAQRGRIRLAKRRGCGITELGKPQKAYCLIE